MINRYVKNGIFRSCHECGKQFDSAQGLSGHRSRSHVNRSQQSTIGKLGARLSSGMRGMHHSMEVKDRLSKLKIEHLSKIKFYSKRSSYRGVTMHSTYEHRLAEELDKNGIIWERCTKALKYVDDSGQIRRYLPDFYIPELNIFLDPKNSYLIKKDRHKIQLASQQNNVKILMLDKENLTWSKVLQLSVEQAAL